MNTKVVPLISPAIVRPADAVTEFIRLVREEIDALITVELWDRDVWPVGGSFSTKGQNRNNRILAFYNSLAAISNQQEVTGEPLDPAIKDFAKAYIRYSHSASPVSYENTQKRLDAIQFIEAAFRNLGLRPAIEKLNVVVLNDAVNLAGQGVGAARHYQFALYIQQVHRFCMDRHYLDAPFQWRHGVRKPKDGSEAIGQEARDRRNEKLPSPEAFHALADIFRTADMFIDQLYSSVCAVCVSIPIRAHEVLQLRLDCEVHGQTTDPETGETLETYGIRVWPGKGNPPQVKWVPTVMVSVVQEAVQRLRELCSNAREVASWYERNPHQLWLPAHLEHYRDDDRMPMDSFNEVVGVKGIKPIRLWLRANNIMWTPEYVSISSLAKKLIPQLPGDFPYYNGDRDQKYSETLVVLLYNEGHAQRGIYRSLIENVTVQSFEHWLSGHDGGKKPSIFKSKGFTEKDGTDIEITTHTFRHWLNTVAQLKGMSDLDIAKWSGRQVDQNPAYNHVSAEETVSQIRAAVRNGNAIGPMFEAAKMRGVNPPVDRRDFIDAQIGSALVTDSGICVHDYSLLPCQSHCDCLGCSENVFVKGDAKHREKIEKRLAMADKQLQDALWAMGEEYYGADRWVVTHEKSIARMRQMLAIHDDPSIPDGTIINLADGSLDNEVLMAIRDRGDVDDDVPLRIPVEMDAALDDVLSSMWED
ncbi:hypothetical protein ACC718_09955 [Rhizobium ruizarguesonis]